MSAPAPGRSALRKAAGWIPPILLSFLLIELVCRFALGIQPLTAGSLVWSHHERWGWFHEPGAEDDFVKPGFSQRVRINEKGLRERDLPYEKPAGLFRILVIGDSSVVSFEVDREDVFLRVAEDRLRAEGRPVQFVNGGVRGWGSDQALLFLEEEGLKYQPDLVLYKWTNNDKEDNATVHRPFRKFGKSWFDLDERGELVLKGVPVPLYSYAENLRVGDDGEMTSLPISNRNFALLWLRDNVLCRSAFGTALIRVALSLPNTKRQLVRLGSYEDKEDVQARLDPEDRLFRTTVAIVQRMQEVSRAAGAEFQMIGVIGAWSEALSEAVGLPVLGDAFRFRANRPEDVPIHMPFDPHLNELGHRIYADAIADALLEAGLLPPPSADGASAAGS